MKHRTVLITGGAGFIGSHLARELLDSGYSVRVLDNLSRQAQGNRDRLPGLIAGEAELWKGDVRSPEDLRGALEGIHAVYYLAYSVGVGQSIFQVADYAGNNSLGTTRLLQALIDLHHKRPIERLIVASSMSIYGEGLYEDERGHLHADVTRDRDRLRFRDWEPRGRNSEPLRPLPTRENKQPDLHSIHALTKFDQERMCLLIGQAYGIPTVAMRFCHVYGRGQSQLNPFTGVLAAFGSRLLKGQPPIIFEDGRQRRDFVHVSDVVKACRLALEVEEAAGHVFNVGSGSSSTISELAKRLAKALAREELQPEIPGRFRVGDVRHCFPDIGLARELLGYKPKVGLEEGIADLARWLKEQKAADHFTEMQDELSRNGLAV